MDAATPFSQLLDELGLTQTQLYIDSGIPMRTMGHWVKGDRDCPPYVLALLRRAYHKT